MAADEHERERLARDLEDIAAQVRAGTVIGYEMDITNDMHDVSFDGITITRELTGRTRFRVNIILDAPLDSPARQDR